MRNNAEMLTDSNAIARVRAIDARWSWYLRIKENSFITSHSNLKRGLWILYAPGMSYCTYLILDVQGDLMGGAGIEIRRSVLIRFIMSISKIELMYI